MLCQACKKADATLHMTSLKACRQIESHYCEPCSRTIDLAYPFAASSGPEVPDSLPPPAP